MSSKPIYKTKVTDTASFIKRAREVHGDRYDYSKVEYIGTGDKVVIICREEGHGEFTQRPYSHNIGRGCPVCKGGVRSNRETFIKRAKKLHGDAYDYAEVEYVNSQTKVKIYCNKHQTFFYQHPNNHVINKQGCRDCGLERMNDGTRLTREEFIRRSIENHGAFYNYDRVDYVTNHQPVEIICPTHGSFFQIPHVHMGHRKGGCIQCAWISAGKKRRITLEEYIKRSKESHGDRYDYSKSVFNGRKNPITIICPVHGEFEQTPCTHMSGGGCRYCAMAVQAGIYAIDPEDIDLPTTLYHVSFQRPDGSSFEKIGITTRTLEERFRYITDIGLTMRVINTIDATLAECIDMEHTLFSIYEHHRYKVHDLRGTRVAGWSECFPPNIVSLFKSYDEEESSEEILR